MTSTSTQEAVWGIVEGDEIAPGLLASRALGGGSAYEVWSAFDEVLHSPVVVKMVRPDQVDDPQTLEGLDREADVLKHLNHPSIVRGFHVELDGPRPLLVLENVDGPRLSSNVRRHGQLPDFQLYPLALELLSTAHYMRHSSVAHLDIKPSNIILSAPATLIDLSVARHVDDAATLTHPIGTDAYMAPEQCLPQELGRPGAASDIWGIGATLFHAAAGRRPYERRSGLDKGTASPGELWPQTAASRPTLPTFVDPRFAAIVDACLAHDPTDRPEPRELARQLEPLMDGLPRAKLSGKISLARR